MTTRLLNVNEVASILDLKPARVYELSREGRLPFLVKIGERQYRYHETGMQNWLLSGGDVGGGRDQQNQLEESKDNG